MAIKRIVSTEFWTDKKVVEQFTPEDKLFFLYLLTNPHTTQLGIYPFIPKVAAFEIGYSKDTVLSLIERFERYEIIMFSTSSGEIAVKNYLKHSIVKGGTPVYDLLVKEANLVKDKSLLRFILNANSDSLNDTVRKFINDIEKDNENEKENDNDNEDSVPNRYASRYDSLKSYGISYPDLKEAVMENKDAGRTCAWCGKKTTVIHKHHYPVPKANGGTQIVEICSDCHAEFHSLEVKMLSGDDPLSVIESFRNNQSKKLIELESDGNDKNNSFDVFWESYPLKKSKQDARKAFESISKRKDAPTVEQLVASVETHKKSIGWKKDGGQFIPYPATYLRKGMYDDELNASVGAINQITSGFFTDIAKELEKK